VAAEKAAAYGLPDLINAPECDFVNLISIKWEWTVVLAAIGKNKFPFL
jgi:hypothetical protein